MDIRNLKPFDKVRINDEGSIWDNRVGIVDFISHGVLGLVTIQDPTHFYIVSEWNTNNVELFN